MKNTPIEVTLARILNALEADLIAATDEEIADAAAELGLKPGMKGSAALADLFAGFLRHAYGGKTPGEVVEERLKAARKPALRIAEAPPSPQPKRTK